jgi:hypothetical protein
VHRGSDARRCYAEKIEATGLELVSFAPNGYGFISNPAGSTVGGESVSPVALKELWSPWLTDRFC